MGPFAEAAQEYRRLGMAVIPCNGTDGKKPAVRHKHFQTSLPPEGLVERWCGKFEEANIGLLTGQISGLTVVDIDDPKRLEEMIERCGETPVMARTPGGGFHLLYAHRGETSRNGVLPGVDVKGKGGIWIAPPSRKPDSQKRYKFIRGGIQDLKALPPAIAGSLSSPRFDVAVENIPEGRRNSWLWRQCMREAASCDDFETFLDVARTRNEECEPPLSKIEVLKIVKSAWNYEQCRQNFIGHKGQYATVTKDEFAALIGFPGAVYLLVRLRLIHGNRDTSFILANAIAPKLGLSLHTFRRARDRLVKIRLLECVHLGGRKGPRSDPPLYRWVKGGPDLDSNITNTPSLFLDRKT